MTDIIHPESEECLSVAMSRRVYDLKNDEELKAAYWEAARSGAAGAAKVCTFLSFIVHLVLFLKISKFLIDRALPIIDQLTLLFV